MLNFCINQVCVALTPNRHQGSRLLSTLDPSQSTQVSQVSLPCDSHGSIDFSSYPFQVSFLPLYFLILIGCHLVTRLIKFLLEAMSTVLLKGCIIINSRKCLLFEALNVTWYQLVSGSLYICSSCVWWVIIVFDLQKSSLFSFNHSPCVLICLLCGYPSSCEIKCLNALYLNLFLAFA